MDGADAGESSADDGELPEGEPQPAAARAAWSGSFVRTNRRAVIMLGAVLALMALAGAMGAFAKDEQPIVCEQPHHRLVESLSPELAPVPVWQVDVPESERGSDKPGDELNPEWFVAAPAGVGGTVALWSVPFDNQNAVVGEIRSLNDTAAQISTWPRVAPELWEEIRESSEIEALLACVGQPTDSSFVLRSD